MQRAYFFYPHASNHIIIVAAAAARLTFLIAEACLVAGSVQNVYHTRYRTLFIEDPPSCHTLRKGVFAAGAAFAFFTAILSEFYYISFSKAYDYSAPNEKEAAVGMSPYS